MRGVSNLDKKFISHMHYQSFVISRCAHFKLEPILTPTSR